MKLLTRRHSFVIMALALLVTTSWLAAKDEAPATRFAKEIEAYEASDVKQAPLSGGIVFTGASGIKLWKTLEKDFPDHQVLNRGFGGCHMSDVVYYADRIVIPYKPKMVIVQAGGNDIASGKSPQQVLADFQALVAKIHAKLPDTPVVYLSMSASPARWAQRDKQLEGNKVVKEFVAKEKNVGYIEMYDAFIGPDGQPRAELFAADKLHHNAEGYKVRTAVVKPHLP